MAISKEQIEEWRKELGNGMTSAVGEYTPQEFWDALDEIERLRSGYERLQDASDCEMGDGDLAREIARDMLRSNAGIKPNRSVKGREPTRQQLQQV